MQKHDTIAYRERLSPSLWLLVAAALVGPGVALVVTPLDSTLALVLGAVAGIGLIGVLIATSSVVEVRDGRLRAGRASIPLEFLGSPVAVTGESARTARGTGLSPRSWHLLRGGIDGVLTVEVTDPDDPVDAWVISSRTPDRLAAAIERGRV